MILQILSIIQEYKNTYKYRNYHVQMNIKRGDRYNSNYITIEVRPWTIVSQVLSSSLYRYSWEQSTTPCVRGISSSRFTDLLCWLSGFHFYSPVIAFSVVEVEVVVDFDIGLLDAEGDSEYWNKQTNVENHYLPLHVKMETTFFFF